MSQAELPEIQSNYAIVEIMGHKIVAGLVSKSEMFGGAMLRVDVPATSEYPAFTQFYGVSAIYAITFVSEQVAKLTAEHNAINPVSVYVPELVTREKYNETVRALEDRLRQAKALPTSCLADDDDDDDDYRSADERF